jgi:uncharacterized protein (TIGR03067 family)
MKGISKGLVMKSLKKIALAILMLGSVAACVAGLARAGLEEPTGDHGDPSRVEVSRLAAFQSLSRNANPGPEASDAPDVRGSWKVLYVGGTVAGKRAGYAMPDRVVRATDKKIVLPALTGDANEPFSDLGPMSYKLQPGLKEQHESAQDQLRLAQTTSSNVEQTARKRVLPEFTVRHAMTKLVEAEKALKNAEKRRAEGKAAGSSEESHIDLEPELGTKKALRGIYRLKSDTLTICFAGPDEARPETFAADQPGESLVILRRGGVESLLPAVPGPEPETVPGAEDGALEFQVLEARRIRIVDVDEFTNLTIRLKNSGTKDATRIQVRAMLSKNIEPIETKNGTGDRTLAQFDPTQQLLVFPPIDRLGAGQEVRLIIKVKGKAKGFGTCRVQMLQDGEDEPLEDVAAFKITAPR